MQNYDKYAKKAHYSDGLLEEYQNARGFIYIDLRSPFVQEDIKKFIEERKRSNDLYGRMLDGLMLDYRESDTLENINAKEFLISRTCDYDTTVVSSDKSIYTDVKKSRVIPGNIRIYGGVPRIVTKTENGVKEKCLKESNFSTIMKTNPRVTSIKYYDKLYNLGQFYMIVGVNGNAKDKDYEKKLEAMNHLSSHLGPEMIRKMVFDEETRDYACVIANPELRRFK